MIQRKVLKNGMTVVFKKRDNKVVSVAFAVRQGGANESRDEKGISHFVEHMLYKGTPTRNSHKISTEIEKNGGELNGFTSEQLTAYWCKMPSKHIDVALNVLGDMVRNPLFDKKEVDKERNVIFEEMKMYKDSPRLYVFEKIKGLLYEGELAIPIIGTKKSMENNTRRKLKDFFDKLYAPENLILCVVGDCDFDYVCNYAEKNFKKRKAVSPRKVAVSKINKELVEKRHAIDQANVVFAFHSPLPSDKDFPAMQVLTILMSGGMSSRLFSEIREKRNLAYAVKGFIEGDKDFAFSGIYVGTTPENVEKVKKIILDEFEKVNNDLSEDELKMVKEQIVGNHLISNEDSHNVLLDLLMSEIRGNAQDAEKFVSKINAVKVEDVKRLAKINSYSFFALVPEDKK